MGPEHQPDIFSCTVATGRNGSCWHISSEPGQWPEGHSCWKKRRAAGVGGRAVSALTVPQEFFPGPSLPHTWPGSLHGLLGSKMVPPGLLQKGRGDTEGAVSVQMSWQPPNPAPSIGTTIKGTGSISQASASRPSPQCPRTRAGFRAAAGRPDAVFAESGARVHISHIE